MTATEAKPEAMTVRSLLDPESGDRYLIPSYQRNYSWGEEEISQLIRDIEDYRLQDGVSPYYIGTLVVHQQLESRDYETVDGQQRLTTLSLLMAYLRRKGVKSAQDFTGPVIHFQSRAKSDRVLKELFSKGGTALLDPGSSLATGFDLVGIALKAAHTDAEDGMEREEWLEQFSRYLCHQVVIFRVHVPADTDLNHYFEVMNSRGEQLEKHEVLKADLVAALKWGGDQVFAKIWEACANMEKYVQMSFTTAERTVLFGSDWDDFRPRDFSDILEVLEAKRDSSNGEFSAMEGDDSDGGIRLSAILERPLISVTAVAGKEGHPDQFHPVINFPNFLLHVLSIHTGSDSIPLDDKNLLGVFTTWLLGKKDDEQRGQAVKAFAYDLLRARYLFDQNVLKRDLRGGSDEWSLLRMKKMTSGSSSYEEAFRHLPATCQDGLDNRRLLMLQAALHISNPSMSYKYWVLGALRYLMMQPEAGKVEAADFLGYLESMARGFVYDIYLPDEEACRLSEVTSDGEPWPLRASFLNRDSQYLRYGSIRNNLLFNFLDYLLWVGNRKRVFRESGVKAEGFKFTTRSSVEHHWPQHPDELGDQVHRFGNLYLISHSKNSKLSNFRADSKKREFLSSGTADSLKQQFMIDHVGEWDLGAIAMHEEKMLMILSGALVQQPPFEAKYFEVPL